MCYISTMNCLTPKDVIVFFDCAVREVERHEQRHGFLVLAKLHG